ncbi:MAG: TIM barrel protein [Eudoraea sp.]|nr:TIM barrel protein [Eudoraea sp.]
MWILVVIGLISNGLSAQEVGLQLYSLRNQFKSDVIGTLDLIESWGITKLEGGETYGMSVAAFKEELRKRNLQVVSVGASFQDLDSNLEAVIQNARDFGATYVMCAWIPHKGNQFGIDEVNQAVDVFNLAGKALQAEGLKLVYHAHGYEFRPYKEGTLFDYMAGHARYFGFEMDVYWVQHGGADPLALLNQYPDMFQLMHLKDMAKGLPGNNSGNENVETNVVLGTGQIQMDKIVQRAKELDIPYLFIEDESSRVVSQVPKSLKYLETIME